VASLSIQKPSQKHQNLTSVVFFQEPIFSVSNTEFEGGGDGHGHGEGTFRLLFGSNKPNSAIGYQQ
jgi:hypothetical protein